MAYDVFQNWVPPILDMLDAETPAAAGGGSQFDSGVVAPSAAPAAPTEPAQYQNTATGFTYNWNIATQTWIPVPKIYRALLTQSGTAAPVATVLENSLGGTLVWSYIGEGNYRGTFTGGFPSTKTIIVSTNATDNVDGDGLENVIIDTDGFPNSFVIKSISAGSEANNSLGHTPIEILVYP